MLFLNSNITRPNCALNRSTILCLYVPGFQRQFFQHVKILSDRSKENKEQKKNKGSFLVAELAYNAQNAQFGLVMNVAALDYTGLLMGAGGAWQCWRI